MSNHRDKEPTHYFKAPKLTYIFLALMIFVFSTPLNSRPTPPESGWVFEGRVFQGEVGDERRPLQGVMMLVYGANDAYPNLNSLFTNGVLIARNITDEKGWYRLEARLGYEFYSIIETDPSGYISVGARAVSGRIRTSNWIQFSLPLEEKTLTGNKFWDKRSSPPPIDTVVPLQQPDLKVSFAGWEIVEDGRVLLLLVDIQNIGNRLAPGTVVRAEEPTRDWFSEYFPVPELRPDAGVSVEISLPISDDRRRMTHTFTVKVAPVQESNERNNVARTSGIPIERITPIVRERKVIVPSLIDSKIKAAKQLIKQAGLRLGELEGNIADPNAIVAKQYPPAGAEVLLNTPVNLVLVTKKPLPIAWGAGGVIIILGLGAGYFFLRKARSKKKMKESIKSRVRIETTQDLGTQQVESDQSILTQFEIRFKPVSDQSKPEVEAKGNLVINERRKDE